MSDLSDPKTSGGSAFQNADRSSKGSNTEPSEDDNHDFHSPSLDLMWTMMFRRGDDDSDFRADRGSLKDLAKIEEKVKSSEDNIATLSRVDPPVGTVLAFAGAWKPKKEEGTEWTEPSWVGCSATVVPEQRERENRFLALFQVLGQAHGNGSLNEARQPITGCNFNLPDYRNLFLRGSDDRPSLNTAPVVQWNRYSALSVALHALEPEKWETQNGVGSYQADSTRLPRYQNFVMDKDGKHSHDTNFETTATRDPGNGCNNTIADTPSRLGGIGLQKSLVMII